eukprot:GHVH01004162.1.p1 GENE.GHVH01004162.1~~GHVH01004162.1.p1  ORF type:complete len:366 (-),score=44.13 GHVH01004162.1:140-1237(-)
MAEPGTLRWADVSDSDDSTEDYVTSSPEASHPSIPTGASPVLNRPGAFGKSVSRPLRGNTPQQQQYNSGGGYRADQGFNRRGGHTGNDKHRSDANWSSRGSHTVHSSRPTPNDIHKPLPQRAAIDSIPDNTIGFDVEGLPLPVTEDSVRRTFFFLNESDLVKVDVESNSAWIQPSHDALKKCRIHSPPNSILNARSEMPSKYEQWTRGIKCAVIKPVEIVKPVPQPPQVRLPVISTAAPSSEAWSRGSKLHTDPRGKTPDSPPSPPLPPPDGAFAPPGLTAQGGVGRLEPRSNRLGLRKPKLGTNPQSNNVPKSNKSHNRGGGSTLAARSKVGPPVVGPPVKEADEKPPKSENQNRFSLLAEEDD